MQTSTNAQQTLKAKHAFKAFAKSCGIWIEHHHANDGHFAENVFLADTAKQGQSMSFCGVNAHWQNGAAEKRICDLQEAAQTMMLHAKHRWPKAIATNLWPHAARLANDALNMMPLQDKHLSPIETFSDSKVKPNL